MHGATIEILNALIIVDVTISINLLRVTVWGAVRTAYFTLKEYKFNTIIWAGIPFI